MVVHKQLNKLNAYQVHFTSENYWDKFRQNRVDLENRGDKFTNRGVNI